MKIAVALWIAVLVLPTASGQARRHAPDSTLPESQRSASDAHSFLELFTKLERDIGVAAQQDQRDPLESTLLPEFTQRIATDPDHAMTRDEWIRSSLAAYTLDPSSIKSVAIRAFPTTAVVSFTQASTISQPITHPKYSFIVDIWTADHGKWRLASRFLMPTEKEQ